MDWRHSFGFFRFQTERHIASTNPLLSSEAYHLINSLTPLPHIPITLSHTRLHSSDILTRLPLELRTLVVGSLARPDFSSTFQASRALYSISQVPVFWRNAFVGAGTFSWMLELASVPDFMEWRQLFRQLDVGPLGPQLSNRQRIWRVFPMIWAVLQLTWMGEDGMCTLSGITGIN